MSTDSTIRYSVVLPVFNEAENIASFCRKAREALPPDGEILVCYDFEGDSTLPALAAITDDEKPDRLRLVRNDLGPGVRYAIEAGFRAAAAPIILVMMADLSDDLSKAGRMVELAEGGCDVVCASRYMTGGRQIGGPWFKSLLSRCAGLSLRWLTGIGTHDPTNSFKAYRAEFLKRTPIESSAGFSLGMELTVKAAFGGGRVDELPATWTDRTAGQSRFRLWAWLPSYLRWYGYALSRSRRAMLISALSVALLSTLFGIAKMALRPDQFRNSGLLFLETGNPLLRADRLNRGLLLYRDLACQYGPLGPYTFAAWQRLFGNTLTGYELFHLVVSVGAISGMFLLLYRLTLLALAIAISILVSLPLMLVPGGVTGGYIWCEHLSHERLCLIAIMLMWVPPDTRSFRTGIGIGVTLGLWQGLKFGGALVAGFAIVVVDLVWLALRRRGRHASINWLRASLATLAAFMAIQGLWVVLATTLLPPSIARDVLWPSYIARAYTEGHGRRLLGWYGWSTLLGHQLLPLLCVAAALLGTAVLFCKRSLLEAPSAFAAVIGFVFFLMAGATGYLAHEGLVLQYVWATIPACAVGICQLRTRHRLLMAPLFSLSLLLAVKVTFLNGIPADVAQFGLPSGESIYVNSAEREDLAQLSARLDELRRRGPRTFFVAALGFGGGGLIYYYDPAYGLRNPFLGPNVFRPYDRQELDEKIEEISGVLVPEEMLGHRSLETALDAVLDSKASKYISQHFEAARPASGRYRLFIRVD